MLVLCQGQKYFNTKFFGFNKVRIEVYTDSRSVVSKKEYWFSRTYDKTLRR